jgi:hypothetical protein
VAVSAICVRRADETVYVVIGLKVAMLVSFDSGWAWETINQGLPVVPFWSDRIHQRLQQNLTRFGQKRSLVKDSSDS